MNVLGKANSNYFQNVIENMILTTYRISLSLSQAYVDMLQAFSDVARQV